MLRRLLAAAALVIAGAGWAQEGADVSAAVSDAPLPGAVPSFAHLEATGATIGEIRIVVSDVFDTSDPREDNALFRAANALHIDTRPSVIRRGLLFASGERLSVRAIEETERLLRGERYLYDVRIRPIAYRDGVADIEVATRDTWTLYPTVTASRTGGVTRTEFGINDYNLLGTGSALSIGYFRNVDRSGTALAFANDNAFGNWTSLELSHAENSDGTKSGLSVVRPFYALDARWSAGLRLGEDDRIDSVYQGGEVVGEYRIRQRHGELIGGRSAGLVDGWVQRYSVGLSLQDNAHAIEPGLVPPAHLPRDVRLVGPFVRYQLIEDRFEKTENRNQMGRPEFFAVGLNSTVQLGWAATALGSNHDALLFEAAISRGFAPVSDHALMAAASVRGQYNAGRIRRAQAGASAQYYLPHHRRWLFFASIGADALVNPDPSDYLYLGGDNGLRGFPLRYQRGTQRALLTLEQRLFTAAFPWRLIRIGAAAYVDVGRAWGGDDPNTGDPGWLTNLGLGLRFFSVRTAFGNVVHLDVAFPVNPAGAVDSVQILLRGRASF